ncbi:MAG: hypothetical protein AAGD01_10950 [Acidobacteriota bacterium]
MKTVRLVECLITNSHDVTISLEDYHSPARLDIPPNGAQTVTMQIKKIHVGNESIEPVRAYQATYHGRNGFFLLGRLEDNEPLGFLVLEPAAAQARRVFVFAEE